MERFLIAAFLILCLASCNAAQAPYDGDCASSMCNGHMMPGNSGGGGGGGGM
jgi:hypothetical protein